MRALDNGGTEALLAAHFAFPAKLVIFLPATLIKKERTFSLEVFRHTGHSRHLLFAAELPICSRNAETPKTVSRCIVSGRFWAFSFDMSGFVLAAVSYTANHSKAAVCRFRVTKKRRIATTLLSCSEDGARERYSIICCTFSFC
ncbi:MAG: hypothetical protein ACLU4Y_06105 [Pseudoruminococcus massiliensis]